MRNLFAALLCSVLLHASLATLLHLSESARSRTTGTGAPTGQSAPLKIDLRLVSSAIERTIPDKARVRVQRKTSESLPIPLPSTISDKLIDTPRAAEPEKHSPSDATEPESQPPSYVSYYPSSQLTTRPLPLNDVMLGPAETAFVAATGTIVLTLWVNELGEVAEVAVETPDLPEEIASGLVSAFKQLHFTPGELSDQKVGVVMQIEVSVN